MSIAEQLFESLKQIGPDIGAELGRLGRQGASEIAAALFHGNPYVQYGPNQITPGKEQQPEVEQQQDLSIER